MSLWRGFFRQAIQRVVHSTETLWCICRISNKEKKWFIQNVCYWLNSVCNIFSARPLCALILRRFSGTKSQGHFHRLFSSSDNISFSQAISSWKQVIIYNNLLDLSRCLFPRLIMMSYDSSSSYPSPTCLNRWTNKLLYHCVRLIRCHYPTHMT